MGVSRDPRGVTALLPLKAHSERVPAKNFRSFHGRPLFRWALDLLLDLDEVDRVIVNTDARKELEGAGLPDHPKLVLRDRPEAIRGDLVSMNRVIEDDLANTPGDLFLQTHVTNPLLQAETVRAAIRRFHEAHEAGEADSLFSVTRHQARFYWRDGRPVNHDPDELLRTQDLPPLLEENSNVYLFTRDSFAATTARIGRRPLMFEMDRLEATDIDDQKQWDLAEALAPSYLGPRREEGSP